MKLEEFTDVAADIVMSSIKSAKTDDKAPLPEHLLREMLTSSDSPVPVVLVHHKIDSAGLLRDLDAHLEALAPVPVDPDTESDVVNVHPRLAALLERAKKSARDANDAYIDTLTVFKQFYTEGTDNKAISLLHSYELSLDKVASSFKKIRGDKKVSTRKEKRDTRVLKKYCVNMIQAASKGEYSPVIGREAETRRIVQILCRKSKNNPIIIGKSGVGKTAIAEGLALRLHKGDVPDFLQDAILYELKMSSLLGGAKHRGDLEERVNELMDVIVDAPQNIILFIDEMHTIGASGGDTSLSDLFKPALSRNKIRIIGATTLDEYRNFIEKDKALERRLQSVFVEPPTVRDTVGILRGLRDTYEAFHGLHIKDAALVTASELSDRYVTFRNLPDKAIDLIDEAAARVRSENEMTPSEMSDLSQKILMLDIEIRSLRKETEDDVKEELADLEKERAKTQEKLDTLTRKFNAEKSVIESYRKAKAAKLKLEAKMADAQAGGSDRDDYYRMKVEDLPKVEAELERAQNSFQELRQSGELMVKEEISPLEIAQVISDWIGIPAENLSKSDREKLATLREDIEAQVYGQPDAVKGVSDAIIRSRAGLSDETRPIGSFLFLGPSGVGKTWLAKSLAKLLFDDYEHMIRIDMSEYGDKHTVSRLVGAPPGYVGFDQGGQLTEAVRRRPYSIVLLDEIEKAHPEVFDVLLQVLDDGRLTDGQGRVVNFKNTIIIMTSNIGSHLLLEALSSTGEVSEEVREQVVTLLKAKYRPEILNRIDEIVVFNPLSKDLLGKIAVTCLEEVRDRLAKKKIKIEWTDELIEYLNSQQYDPSQGARGMKSFVKKHVETDIAGAIVRHHDITNFKIDVADGKVQIQPVENS